jgi:hypothetical protein
MQAGARRRKRESTSEVAELPVLALFSFLVSERESLCALARLRLSALVGRSGAF